ncbi:MAG: aminoacyl-histidine dipeptidase [Thermoplasmata archaeon]|nr:MAG: aminoacyl-histidine dipeptidase [Thermoplasmata archaeon]
MELDIEPKEIWKHFEEICKIPHCSKHEEKLGEYIINIAKEKGLEVQKDEIGNVVVRKKASPGYEHVPTVILQGHIDMVCEKNKDVEHDFEKDPIPVYQDGEYLKAKGTTLGADNGVGVAIALAIMEKDIVSGNLEFLFTVDEETGLTGASHLKPDFIKGRMLLNLDSEEFGSIYIGCAGGGNSTIRLPLTFIPSNENGLQIMVKGLRGGHSGTDIDKGRANAIKLLARILWNIDGYKLSSIEGGDKHNAIPREASAVILPSDEEKVRKVAKDIEALLREEFSSTEPNLAIEIKNIEVRRLLSDESQQKVLHLLMALPHGVLAMSQDVKGLVETSTNLATVRTNDALEILMSSRSSVKSSLQFIMQVIRAIGEMAGAEVKEGDLYPGWKPNLNSRLLHIASETYKELFGKEPEKKAIHAGLETGIIGEKIGNMDMISIGPQIEYPHSPDERVHIPSVQKFYTYLLKILENIAKEKY